MLDLGNTAYWVAALGPPDADGLPRLFAALPFTGDTVSVYDLRSGAVLGTFALPDGVLNMIFSPDGDLIIGTGTGRLVVVDPRRLGRSDVGAEAIRWSRAAHSGSLQTISASDDGLIASGSSAGNVRVWSADGTPLADLPVTPDGSPASTFSPDGRALFYEDADGVVRRFLLDDDERAALAHSMLTRWFSPDECALYFPDERCPAPHRDLSFSVS